MVAIDLNADEVQQITNWHWEVADPRPHCITCGQCWPCEVACLSATITALREDRDQQSAARARWEAFKATLPPLRAL